MSFAWSMMMSMHERLDIDPDLVERYATEYEELRKNIQFTDETRRKIADKARSRTVSAETKELHRIAATGRVHTTETRQAISNALSGKKRSQESCDRISQAKTGRPSPRKGITLSEDTRKKISETRRLRCANGEIAKIVWTQEQRDALSTRRKGIPITRGPLNEEHKRKIGDAIRRRKSSQEPEDNDSTQRETPMNGTYTDPTCTIADQRLPTS